MDKLYSQFIYQKELLVRNCPICNVLVTYKTKYKLNRAIRLNRKCISCVQIGKHHTSETKLKISNSISNSKKIYNTLIRLCPECGIELKYKTKYSCNYANNKNKLCTSCINKSSNNPFYGKKHTDETKKKQASIGINNYFYGISKSGEDNYFYGQKHTDETKYKLRLLAIENMKDKGVFSNYNPKACKFIDTLNILMEINLQHALNGGEVQLYGYFVDGYDKEKNIILEYDEPEHEKPSHKKGDIEREKDLIKEIKPTMFLRFSEKYNKLYTIQT